MRPARQHSKHALRIAVVNRLPENRTLNHDHRVRAEHRPLLCSVHHRARFGFGETAHVLLGRFPWKDGLVNVGDDDVELDAGGTQELGSPR